MTNTIFKPNPTDNTHKATSTKVGRIDQLVQTINQDRHPLSKRQMVKKLHQELGKVAAS